MICAILMTLVAIGPSQEVQQMKIVKQEKFDIYQIEKIYFSGHTYIHFKNKWNNHDSAFLHDLDCHCIKENLRKVIESREK